MMTQPAPPSTFALEYLRRFVHTSSGIVLDGSKNYLFQARLSPLLAQEGLADFDQLIVRLNGDRALGQQVVEAMTTNETSFFRDHHPFEALRKVILPELSATRKDQKSLTIWSAASSTGQELYSVAFLIKELGYRFPGWNIRLIGTDLSSEVVERAQTGRFSQLEVNRGLPAPVLIRNFKQVGTEWQVNEDIRKMTEFRVQNLIGAWQAMPPLDIVFLRNVLIYFDVPTRRRILDRIAPMIRLGGYLFLGGVETTVDVGARLSMVHIEKTICYQARPEGEKHASLVPA